MRFGSTLDSKPGPRNAGRVLVFDHPTLHVSPADNARWLCERLPTGRPVAFDLLAHSRGGLVAREVGLRPEVTVNRMPQVATPNAGTALCSTKRIGQLLDVTTNLASLLPDPPFSTTLQGVLEAAKRVGIGSFRGLRGLTVDRLFGEDNDLVVPTASMSAGGGFVVKNPFRARVGPGERSVAHTSYFGASCVRTEIARCLALPPG